PDCAIIGGPVYRRGDYARLEGIYFYGDYCSGRVFGLRRQGGGWQAQKLYETGGNVSSFGVDEAGRMYVVLHGLGVPGSVALVTDSLPPSTPTPSPTATPKVPICPPAAPTGTPPPTPPAQLR